MNKYLLLLILPLLSFIMTGCNDSGDDVKPINLGTFTGTWEVVYQGNQDVLPRDCILNRDIQLMAMKKGTAKV